MMDNPALDKMLDQPDQAPMVIWRGIPCEVIEYHLDQHGVAWCTIRALHGEPFPRWTHGGWAYYPDTAVGAKWAEANTR